ncbi:AzlD domain-containing protein [Haloarchaeobius amylolyticus]|uniref:AzlD domain-containing protein n=1 Tax=Haloarchaeobius amylolyticus TaxID=1198296 RepID=UPI002271588B
MTGYDSAAVWAVIVVAGVGTFAIRFSFILLLGRIQDVPDRVESVLRLVPAAVLAALVVPSIVALETVGPAGSGLGTGGFALAYDPAKVVAGAVAAAVAWRTEDVLATIAVGMVTLWLVDWATGTLGLLA